MLSTGSALRWERFRTPPDICTPPDIWCTQATNPEFTAKLKILFTRLDTNHSGMLEPKEVAKLLEVDEFHSQVTDTFERMDTDKDGFISFEEWNKSMLEMGLSDEGFQEQFDSTMKQMDKVGIPPFEAVGGGGNEET